MENEKEKKFTKPQIFYFNEKGQLVVESNKGIWVDGEQYVKMYGHFECNAKTMGEVINKIKGIPVEVGAEETIRVSTDSIVDEILGIHEHTIQHYCVLGADKRRISEYEETLAKQHYESTDMAKMSVRVISLETELKETSHDFNKASDEVLAYIKAIDKFNKLPWWKRIFKKIKLK